MYRLGVPPLLQAFPSFVCVPNNACHTFLGYRNTFGSRSLVQAVLIRRSSFCS